MAEAIFRMRQQAADRQTSTDQLLAGAARAERSAHHATDRLRDWFVQLERHDRIPVSALDD